MCRRSFLIYKGRNSFRVVSTFFLFICLVFSGCHRSLPVEEYQLPDTVRLQSGDLVFRAGISRESRAVTAVDRKSMYTHVGMLVWTDSGWRVLHAVPSERASKQEEDSVKFEPIGTFFRSDRAVRGGVYRYPVSPEDTLQLLNRALVTYARHPLFDNLFDAEDTTAFYCTELACFLYQQVMQTDLSEGRRHNLPLFPNLIFCSDVFQNDSLREVFAFER